MRSQAKPAATAGRATTEAVNKRAINPPNNPELNIPPNIARFNSLLSLFFATLLPFLNYQKFLNYKTFKLL